MGSLTSIPPSLFLAYYVKLFNGNKIQNEVFMYNSIQAQIFFFTQSSLLIDKEIRF